MRIVIIGNGVAGIEAALEVRRQKPHWPITLVSEESDHFFSRTALMWVCCGQMSPRDIEPFERDLYARMALSRVRARAVGVDVERRQVRLSGDLPPIAYDRLLIACGSRPRPGPWPGSELTGVGSFVTLQDLDWLARELHGESAQEQSDPPWAPDSSSPYARRPAAAERRGACARQPAVLGGGLIGLEVVEICLAAGLCPRFFVREQWFWPMAIDPREAAWITERLREHGVEVHLEHEIQALEEEDGVLARVVTSRGVYPADLAVIATGVVPNTQWLRSSAIALHERGGVLVGADLATSAPDVFAAGDCALVPWPDGKQRAEQLWYTARAQGRVAGRRLLGEQTRYDRGLWYNSAKLMDIEYTTVGLVNMRVEGEQNWSYEERGRVRSMTRIVTLDDRVIGVNLLGRRWDHSVLLRFIAERRPLKWVLEHLSHAAFDSEFVPPAALPRSPSEWTRSGPVDNPALPEPTRYPYL